MLFGNEMSFKTFFDDMFPRLYRFVLVRVNGLESTAEEIAQATLCAVVQKLSSYRGEASLFTWICTFARHEISHHMKKHGRASVSLTEDSPEIRAALESLASTAPDAELEQNELSRLVYVALDHLNPKYREVLTWKYLDGLSVNEIAMRLEAGPKSVESTLTRARNSFRDGFSSLLNPSASGRYVHE